VAKTGSLSSPVPRCSFIFNELRIAGSRSSDVDAPLNIDIRRAPDAVGSRSSDVDAPLNLRHALIVNRSGSRSSDVDAPLNKFAGGLARVAGGALPGF
jgi:hypothetical protein